MKESAKEKSASGSAVNSFSSGTGGPVGGARAGRSRHARMARVAAGGWTTESHRMRAPQPGHSSTSMAKTRRKSSAQPNRRDREEKPSLASVVEARGRDSIDGTLRRAAGNSSSGIFNQASDAGPVPVCELGPTGFKGPAPAACNDFGADALCPVSVVA